MSVHQKDYNYINNLLVRTISRTSQALQVTFCFITLEIWDQCPTAGNIFFYSYEGKPSLTTLITVFQKKKKRQAWWTLCTINSIDTEARWVY